MKDAHGRTIDYLRLSLTDRCNFRCNVCLSKTFSSVSASAEHAFTCVAQENII